MNKISKKLWVILTAGVMATSALALSSCDYRSTGVEAPSAQAQVSSQGGWAVKKGQYVYFINGVASKPSDDDGNTAYENKFGEVCRGALLRIKTEDMTGDGDYADKAETIVPLVIGGEDYGAGIFIYGDRVYYATPSTAKNLEGQVESDYVDFKSSTLDGKSTMKNYYFRASASSEYRIVEVNGVVYIMHFDGSDLYSYNTATNEDNLLVKNTSTHVFNTQDKADPYVYYTMAVEDDVDRTVSVSQNYTQVYRVRADAEYTLGKKTDGKRTVSVKGYLDDYTTTEDDANQPSYGYEFTFDVNSLENIATAAKEDGEETDFNAGKAETYPYFNLGQIIFDGVGKKDEKTMFSHSDSEPYAPAGFQYSLVGYQNGGLYYTRSYVDGIGSNSDGKWTFYVAQSELTAQWDSISGNADTTKADFGGKNTIIAKDSTNANESAFFYIKEGKHFFIYTDGGSITRVEVGADGSEQNEMLIAKGSGVSVASFMETDDSGVYKYIYYTTASGGVGRAVYDSDEAGYSQESYHKLTGDDKYAAVNILCEGDNALSFTHVSGWYAPEIIEGNLFFADGSALGDKTANTAQVIHLKKNGVLLNNAEWVKENEKLEEVSDLFEDATSVSLYNAAYYYYYTGTSDLFYTVIAESVEEGNTDTYIFSERQKEFFNGLVKREGEFVIDTHNSVDFSTVLTGDNGEYYGLRSYFFHTISTVDNDEYDELENIWRVSYLNGTAISDEMQPWAWALIGIAIGVGSIGLLCALIIPAVLLVRRERANRAAKQASGRGKKQYTVDMSDNSDIDVYATDEESAPQEPSEE